MTRHPAICSTLVAVVALVASSHACTAILDFPEEVTGYLWCLDATPATGLLFDSLSLIEIRYATSNNWTRGCKCLCAADHQLMLQGAAGELTPDSEDAIWYDLQVGQLRASAVNDCDGRTAELAADYGTLITFDDPETISCLDSVTDETPYFAAECGQLDDVCPPGAPGGFGTDGYIPGTTSTTSTTDADSSDTGLDDGSDSDSDSDHSDTTTSAALHAFDDWSSIIDCPTRTHCNVDATVIQALLVDPTLLSQDHVRIAWGISRLGHRGLHFLALDPDSFPAALGLEPGDVPWRVNGIELRTLADIAHALEVLTHAMTVTAEIDRGEVTVTRTYRIIE
jgi:hypothetical protein